MDEWQHRVSAVWAAAEGMADLDVVAAIDALVAEREPDDAAGLFEAASARDYAGLESEAEPLYRQAIAGGLDAATLPRAVIQLASTLRNLGQVDESIELLEEHLAEQPADAWTGPGAAFLALQTGAPVVPVGLIGTAEVMPVGARMPSLRSRVTVRFGPPLDLSVHGAPASGRARRVATDAIMAAIHELTDQELAGVYNEAPAHGTVEKIRRALPHERL